MSTLMIRLDHPPPGEQMVIRGYTVQHGELGWHEDGGPVKAIPRELPIVETRMERRCLEDLARTVLITPGAATLTPIEVGRHLWRLITEGEVGAWWTAQVRSAAGPVRTILDIQPPALRALPWELMTPPIGKPVFHDDRNPWVRAQPNWPPLDELALPVQILVLVGENDSRLAADREIDAIHRCVASKPASWHVEVLSAPSSIKELRDSCEKFDPHILHVIGHTARRDDRYVLRIVPPEGNQWSLTVDDVLGLPTPAPRLVVLNCCRTSQAGAAVEPEWGFSESFMELGSAAVVTMQGDIKSEASVAFTASFYQDLVAGKAIDAAAARARLEVSDIMSGKEDRHSWALPSLVVSTDPDRVLPVRERLTEAELNKEPYHRVFEKVCHYVDRSSERRTVLKALDSVDDPPRVLLLEGQHKAGRSAVLRSTLLTVCQRGRDVVYVDLDAERLKDRGRKLNWLPVLRLIRDAIWTWVPDLDDKPRRQFDHELSYLIVQQDVQQPWSEAAGRPDSGQDFIAAGEDYKAWASQIVVAFRRMLAGAAADRPFLLALDSLSAIDEKDLDEVLAEQLLRPLMTGGSPDGLAADLQCLTAASADELAKIPHAYRRVEIKPFEREALPRLVGEYIARHGLGPDPSWRQSLETILRNTTTDAGLKPNQFSDALRAIAGLGT